jgi:hypothetical protein
MTTRELRELLLEGLGLPALRHQRRAQFLLPDASSNTCVDVLLAEPGRARDPAAARKPPTMKRAEVHIG